MPELTQEVTINFEAYCGTCGAGICANVTTGSTSKRGYPFIEIVPCETCLLNSFDEGKEAGEDAARRAAE